MTKTLTVQSLLSRTSLVGLMLAAAATFGMGSAANAQAAGTGSLRGAVCQPAVQPPHGFPLPPGTGGHSSSNSNSNASAQLIGDDASTQFITLTGAASTEGFNNTSAAIQLSQDGAGTAGLIIKPVYTIESATNDFYGFRFKYKGSGGNVKQSTTVKYCFQNQDGTGNKVSFSIKLNKIPASAPVNGFTEVAMFASDFGNFNVQNLVLRKVVISIANSGNANNIVIGYNQIDTVGGGNPDDHGAIIPNFIDLTEGNCSNLTSCPTGTAAD